MSATKDQYDRVELNLDGLPGPTHNFAGLAHGNLASARHRFATSRPKEAALQALDKMKLVNRLGQPVGVAPPQLRPDLNALRKVGFGGPVDRMLQAAQRTAPELFCGVYSSSAMWTANAATVSGAENCKDGKVHLTPANLISQFHRSLETNWTERFLRHVFADDRFVIHEPLPSSVSLRDEGAANHLSFKTDDGSLEVFVYGSEATNKFQSRQTRSASLAVARLHRLKEGRVALLEQNPAAIDAGVFHNDVISVSNENIWMIHEEAFSDAAEVERISALLPDLCVIRIDKRDLSLQEAVESYFFNSLILSIGEGKMAIVAPEDCERLDRAKFCLESILDGENPIEELHFVPLRESMKNGGGPACLRLRVPMRSADLSVIHQGIRYNAQLDKKLRDWVEKHYREELHMDDLLDPNLIEEAEAAHNEILVILGLEALGIG